MDCDVFDRVVVSVDKQTRVCPAKDEKITFDGYVGHLVCPDPDIVCGIIRYNQTTLTLPTETHAPLPDATRSPIPPPSSPAEGYKLVENYQATWSISYHFIGSTVTNTHTWVQSLTEMNGVEVWIPSMNEHFVGTVAVFTETWVKSNMLWYTAVRDEEVYWGGINGVGWVGIILAVACLVVFIGAVLFCQRKADREWEQEQALYARQRRGSAKPASKPPPARGVSTKGSGKGSKKSSGKSGRKGRV
jgi:hypothetical protein